MCVNKLVIGVNLIVVFFTITLTEQQQQQQQFSSQTLYNDTRDLEPKSMTSNTLFSDTDSINTTVMSTKNRVRRSDFSQNLNDGDDENKSSFDQEEIGWSVINDQVDMVIPMVLAHLQKLGIEHLQLPNLKESLTLNPLFVTYEAGLYLTDGIVYNIAGIKRYENAYMTYEGKSFLTRFNLIIKNLQFEYNFLLKMMPIEGYGKVIGSLDDTIIYAELAVNVPTSKLQLNDFRIVKFNRIHVQLDQMRIIREISGLILTPITNLFKDRITTSISDGLKDQMQILMDDFNDDDPLGLRKFTKKILAGLTGQTSED